MTDALNQPLLEQTFTANNIEQLYRLITEKTLDIGTVTGLMHLDQHEVLSLVFKLNLHTQT